jgi:hypothetical protein
VGQGAIVTCTTRGFPSFLFDAHRLNRRI